MTWLFNGFFVSLSDDKNIQAMKKTLFIILTIALLLPMSTVAQTYQSLWKQVEEARSKDLPRHCLICKR